MPSLTSDCKYAVILTAGVNGLGAVRSLAKMGVKPIVVSEAGDLARRSKHCFMSYVFEADDNWEESLSSLLHDIDLPFLAPLIACSDKTANFICKHKHDLEKKYSLLCNTKELCLVLNDKRLEVEQLRNNSNIVLPETITNLSQLNPSDKTCPLRFPVIVKPRTSEHYKVIGAKNLILSDEPDWQSFVADYSNNLDCFIAQEIIRGEDETLWVCNATFDQSSEMVCAFTFKRLGTSPSHFGVTSIAISILNEEIIATVKEFAKTLGYVGPAMFEFKYESETGRYVYIETNPRLGMCNWFDTCCGINNVYATWLLAQDLEVDGYSDQIENILYINFLTDFVARLEDRENPLKIIKRYFHALKYKRSYPFSLFGDPLPYLKVNVSLVGSVFKRVLKRIPGFKV